MDLETLRLDVYRSFAEHGHPPTFDELQALVDAEPAAVVAGLRELAAARHLALDSLGRIVMAHPFSAVPLGFSVMGADTLWWGGCAWDSFAIPHLVEREPEVLVATQCPSCRTPHAWVVDRHAPPDGNEVAHFLVPAARMWDDVVHTCGNQRIFCDETCVDRWLARSSHERGYVMDLATLWRLGRDWYAGRLSSGYVRREPGDAAAYLREVGLEGEFWGL